MMHVNFNLSVIFFCKFLSKMCSSFLNVLQKIICVMLTIKFLFLLLVVGARANSNSNSNSGAPWLDAGLTVCSITIIFTSLALTPCNFAVQLGH